MNTGSFTITIGKLTKINVVKKKAKTHERETGYVNFEIILIFPVIIPAILDKIAQCGPF